MGTRRLLAAAAALLALAALLAGPPLVLLAVIGNPLPDWASLRSGHLDDATVIRLLACLAWLAWAQFAAGTLLEAGAAARGARLPRHIALGQGLSRTLITIILTSTALAPFATQLTTLDANRAAATPPPPAATVTHHESPATSPTPRHSDPGATSGGDYTVGSDSAIGPTLWSIAEHKLGDPLRWTDIWQLNRDRVMPDGQRFTDPDLIRDGWVLHLPAPTAATLGSRPSDTHVDVIQAGDTLSAVARAEYGDPNLYPVIAGANQGRPEPDGRIFTDPNRIWPGDTVTIPTVPATSHTTTPPRTGTPPGTGTTAPGGAPTQTPPPTTTTGPTSTATQATAPSTTPSSASSEPTTTPASTPASRPAAPASTSTARHTATPTTTPPSRTHADTQWLTAAVAGGGAVLAGACLAGLARRRRQQWRHRGPGRMIATAATDRPRLAQVEKTLRRAAGDTGAADVAWLDTALRSLAAALAARGLDAPAPDVLAACLTGQRLELVLAEANLAPPDPWQADAAGARWTLERELLPDNSNAPTSTAPGKQWAPFPTLVSVGYREDGEHWLIDLERTGVLQLTGDPDRSRNLMRFLAAELSHNAWSDHLQVSVVGFGDELAGLNPERITCTDDTGRVLALLHAQLDGVAATSAASDTDALAARVHGIDVDAFIPHIALLATGRHPALPDVSAELTRQQARVPLALVVCLTDTHNDNGSNTDHARSQRSSPVESGCHGVLNPDGTLTLGAPLNLTLTAHQLPAAEAADLAALLALAEDRTDRVMPPARGNEPWDQHADVAGAVRPDTESLPDAELPAATGASGGAVGIPGADGSPDAHAGGLLTLPPAVYLNRAATTPTDLDVLSPTLTTATRQRLLRSDPGLDADLATWRDPAAMLPKLHLLGPITLTGIEAPPARRGALLIEIVAYLSSHPRGVTVEQLATDLWPHIPDAASKTTPRQSVSMTRQWLGVNPHTGRERLPRAVADPAGLKLYRVEDVLADAELFRRLRLRAIGRGEDGITDLHAALALVTGPPLSGRRPGGYSWLADTPLDHEYTAMIVDVAHLVATHELATGDPAAAAQAARTALDAGALDDNALLDLVAACHAQDRHAEAEEYVRRILANHDAEVEEDLPPRTYEVLRRHGWLPV